MLLEILMHMFGYVLQRIAIQAVRARIDMRLFQNAVYKES
jgi:hypothetical protein